MPSSGRTRFTARSRPPGSASWSRSDAGGLTATRSSAISSASIGSPPGTMPVMNHRSARRRLHGAAPGAARRRTTDDLPEPDGPTSTTNGRSRDGLDHLGHERVAAVEVIGVSFVERLQADVGVVDGLARAMTPGSSRPLRRVGAGHVEHVDEFLDERSDAGVTVVGRLGGGAGEDVVDAAPEDPVRVARADGSGSESWRRTSSA